MEYLLRMERIEKTFHGTRVLKNISFGIRPGEVHALIGGNGAGKSTLMKIISGAFKKDSGQIFWMDNEIEIQSTRHSTELGISIIYQELNQMPNLSIAENIFIGREHRKGTFMLDAGRTVEEAEKYVREVGLNADVRTPCGDLSIAQRQMVEVARALSANAKLIIMDEPTSSLTERETEILMSLIRKLKQNGVSVVFISHKLNEIFEISDRISVLRDGELVGCVDTAECSNDMLIRMMVGREITEIFPKKNVPLGDVVLSVKNLTAGKSVQNVSFDLHKGEILGFAGLVGAGRSETMRAIFGVDKAENGEITVDGKPLALRHKPGESIAAGIGFLPEDRQLQGLVLGMSVRENTTMANMDKTLVNHMVSYKREAEITQEYVDRLSVRAHSIEQKMSNLSGGNQQKVVLGKWLNTDPKVLILDEPTRGIDIGAKKEIYTLMGELTARGVAIIMISSEFPEVLGMSDRVIVMCEGSICGEFLRGEATQEKIMKTILTFSGGRD